MAERRDGFIYEPESITPDNLPPLPVGTLAELHKEGLDPSQVACCHREVKDGSGNISIVGCKYRVADGDGVMQICTLADRDTNGPRNYGIKHTKGKVQGGATIRGQRDCFWIAQNKRPIEANGGHVKIIAWEPEEKDGTRKDGLPTSFETIEFGPGDTPVSLGVKPIYKFRPVTKTVQPFPRPGENPEMAAEILKALERAESEKEKAVRRDEGFVG